MAKVCLTMPLNLLHLAVESIIRPELSKIHLGVALRDYDWEMEHHMKPHIVYSV